MHKVATHKYGFIGKLENVHTQNIESFNNKLKVKIKKSLGVLSESMSSFLDVFMWPDMHEKFFFIKHLIYLNLNFLKKIYRVKKKARYQKGLKNSKVLNFRYIT